METRQVKTEHGDLVLGEATTLMGMRRWRLISAGSEAETDNPDLQLLQVALYPDCVAALVSAPEGLFEGEVPTVAEFAALPEQLVERWLAAVYELNPHWRALPEEQAEENQKN